MQKRFLFILLIAGLVTIAASQVATLQAAPARSQAKFGVVMKPGWGGGSDTPNYTLILVLRCAMLERYRTRPAGTTVVTGSLLNMNSRSTCAIFPARGMGTGEPIGKGFPFVPYTGVPDAYPQRPNPPTR